MSKKHTPGPWAAFSDGDHTNIVSYVPKTDLVFSLPGRNKSEPDVRLIAAAPDLLEFAQEFLRDYRSEDGMFTMKHYAAKAMAAITKATGVQA